VLLCLGTIIIHDLLEPAPGLQHISNLVLLGSAPLYGNSQGEQDLTRTFEDGKLKPDCFSEKRLLSFPPGTGVLIFFSIYHYLVDQLATIDQDQRFSKHPISQWTNVDPLFGSRVRQCSISNREVDNLRLVHQNHPQRLWPDYPQPQPKEQPTDCTPRNLTKWGFNETDYDLTVDNGQVFYKLILHALPRHYEQNSAYVHLPLVRPDENDKSWPN